MKNPQILILMEEVKNRKKMLEKVEEMNKLINFDKFKWRCKCSKRKPSKGKEKL